MTPVDILCPDLSDNAVGRALVLARLLGELVDVRILGMQSRAERWAPSRNSEVPLVGLRAAEAVSRTEQIRWLRREVSGRRLVVSKARWTSLALALAAGLAPSLIWLDLDDFELGLVESRLVRRPRLIGSVAYHVDWWRARQCERLAVRAGSREEFAVSTVANRWLLARYGGELLYHLRDAQELNPERVDRQAARIQLRLLDRPWAGFVGTLRPHKGVEDLIAALEGIQEDPKPGLLLAGVDSSQRYDRRLVERAEQRLGSARVRVLGTFEGARLADIVSLPDVIVIPSRNVRAARGQTPAKVFDALCMGKAVVASRVADMPGILGEAGQTFVPGDVDDLRRKLAGLLFDAGRRAALEALARAQALKYTFESARAFARERLARLPVIPG